MKNLKEFKELILRYESITEEEIEIAELKGDYYDYYGNEIARKLIGFGTLPFCIICNSVNGICDYCVYGAIEHACFTGNNKQTYELIEYAKNASELLSAFRSRANHMREILKEK